MVRNTERHIPIPKSTIIGMEQTLELPDPSKYQWELRSSVLHNNGSKEVFLRNGRLVFAHCSVQYDMCFGSNHRDIVHGLIAGALANPETPLPKEVESKVDF